MIRKNFFVKQKTAEEVLAGLPNLKLVEQCLDGFDVLVCSAGFEERVLALPRKLLSDGALVSRRILVGEYCTNSEDNAARFSELSPILDKLCSSVQFFNADSPDMICKALVNELASDTDDSLRVAFDISGASSTFIISVIYSLLTCGGKISLTIFYSTAEIYHEPLTSDRADPVSLWDLSDYRELGVGGVDVNELIPGLHQDSSPRYVIAFPSMFCARLERCLNYLNVVPQSGTEDSAYWVLPAAVQDEHEWRQLQIHNMVAKLIYGDVDGVARTLPDNKWCSCDALDYKQSANIVFKQVDENLGANISVIHLGTKIQALGVALVLVARKEISHINSRPTSFSAQNYSKGIGKLYQIGFGEVLALVEEICSVGSLTVQPQ